MQLAHTVLISLTTLQLTLLLLHKKVAKELQEKGHTQIFVPAFVDKLVDLFKSERSFDHWASDRDRLDADKLHTVSEKNAWIAVTNELFNSRHSNSLTSAGLLYFQYESTKYCEIRDGIAEELVSTGLTNTEAEALMQRLFMDGVYSGALNAGKTYKFTPEEREFIFFKGDTKYKVTLACPRK